MGADNWAFEVVPAVDPERPFVAHQHLIAESGTYIVENLTTRACAIAALPSSSFVMTSRLRFGCDGRWCDPRP